MKPHIVFLLSLWAVLPPTLSAQTPETPAIRIALLGDPSHQVVWTDEALAKLQEIGFNEVQLNIAWGDRPFGEALNLLDVVTVPGETERLGVAERRAELKRRVQLARKHGLRTLFHFGSPFMDRNPYTGDVPGIPYRIDDLTYDSWYDILNPKVRDHELQLLREFRRQFPEVTDILVYTYDQDAWQTPEYQYNSFSYGKPLAERLPAYLAALHQVWTEGREGTVRMWWEPWELSAGQEYAMLPQLPRRDFGLMIHSNFAEVQLALPVDLWFRNTARMCHQFGIPVVAEGFFASTTEEFEPLSIPVPRLVDEQYQALLSVKGIVGVKEYYGINTDLADLDLDLLRARLHRPAATTDELLQEITRDFGGKQGDVLTYLALVSDSIAAYPWDASWLAREVGHASVDHGWSAATVRGSVASTPAWETGRRLHFMKTDNLQSHFWMLEDVQLRCELAADLLTDAFNRGEVIIAGLNPPQQSRVEAIQRNIDSFRHVSRSYALHLRETNVAQMLRQDQASGRPLTKHLVSELTSLLVADVANQGGQGRVVEMSRLCRENPGEFVRRYLVPVNAPAPSRLPFSADFPAPDPTPEKGLFTLTTR